jgi:aldehyde dehydrogenase (NAD+)
VLEDADLDQAVMSAHIGLFLNHGQCCCASSRLFVQESVYDAFVAKATALANSIKVGPQFDAGSQQGPQVDDIQFKSVMRYIELGKSQGAKVMAGGDRALAKGFYVQPTIFADVTDEMTIAKEEVRDRRHSSILISCSTSTIFRIVTLSQ